MLPSYYPAIRYAHVIPMSKYVYRTNIVQRDNIRARIKQCQRHSQYPIVRSPMATARPRLLCSTKRDLQIDYRTSPERNLGIMFETGDFVE